MKKICLFAGLLIAGLAFVACDEDFKDWEQPQQQEQMPDRDSAVVSAEIVPTDVIKYDEASDVIELLKPGSKMYSMDDAETLYSMLYLEGIPVKCVSENGSLFVEKETLKEAVEECFKSKRAVVRDLNFTVDASVLKTSGTAYPTVVEIGEQTNQFTVQFLPPLLPDIAYEKAYYYIGGYNGWNLAEPTPMTDNGDGTYSCTITIGGNEWFAFAPQSAVDNQDWNLLFRPFFNGDTATSGFFSFDGTTGFSYNSEISGPITFTISPQDWTYSYAKAPASFYFVTGTPNGWTSAPQSAFYSSDDGQTFEYTTEWTGAWDLKAWTLDDVGNWDNAIGTVENGDGSESGSLIAANAQAFQSPGAGLYTLHVDFKAMTYYWELYSGDPPTKYNQISLAGDFNGWGDTDLTANADGYNWYILGIELSGNVKFKAEHDWGTNWGAAMDVPGYGQGTQDGPNIPVPDGVYNVYLNTITGQCVFIKVQ